MEHQDIRTERFVLKILTPALVGEDYLSWFSDPVVTRFIAFSRAGITIEELRAFAAEKLASPEALFFGIFTQDGLRHIGNIKLEPISSIEKYCVLGVLIGAPEWRGKGVFFEIQKALVKALVRMGIEKIYLGVDLVNDAAILAYEKSGYEIDSKNFLEVNAEKAVSMVKHLSLELT